ncbi:MAG: hypothetical protein JO166_04435 [Deltaproteobacteria bacterium]|nr:hypothetical protein [Deltaproteobacteria bacterium]
MEPGLASKNLVLIRLRPFSSALITALLAVVAINSVGCSEQRTPMEVSVTQLAPYVNAAKDPGCTIPVLETMPMGSYTQVAIVEAWADLKDTKDDVLPALRRKACETGADAVVILNSSHQDVKQLLYQASPNEQLNETTQQNVYAGQGEYIREMEHTRRIGEAGHNGLYIDAVAVTYNKNGDKEQGDGTAAAAPRSVDPARPQG